MRQATTQISVRTQRQGLVNITERVTAWVAAQGLQTVTLGTWQAIYLFEHRRRPQTRTVVLHVLGTDVSE